MLWLVQDFEGTLSVKSTARDESPGPGKVSPLDRLEEERKKKAEMLAAAADKWVQLPLLSSLLGEHRC